MILTLLSAVPVFIWLYLLFCRGGFWRVTDHAAGITAVEGSSAAVVAIVPARDEAAVIGEAVQSLLVQRIRLPIHVIVVDDGSSDGTAEAARVAAERIGLSERLTVVSGQPLPSGWTGKLWAVSQGVSRAQAMRPDYFLLTDADIRHEPDSIRRLLATSEAYGRDLSSYMVKLSVASSAEKLLIPAFVYFFFQLYPPRWIASEKFKTAGAAGGCMLIRPDALARAGGISAIRHALIDDCALAAAVKRTGGRLSLGLTEESRSIRSYGGFGGVGQMISRSAFHQLHHSLALLIVTVLGLGVTYLLPPLLLLSGKPLPILFGLLAWSLMCISYAPMLRFYGRSAIWTLSLPAVALFYAACTVHSAYRFWRGVGGSWKGRNQDRGA